ncbi:MAG TPA: DUF4349 domain-containing protein [Candidatus Elarobacter sp.]|jgi:hypothetical protein
MTHPVAELLPFYANGTLDAADRARVEDELATCPSCAAELREIEALGAALHERAAAAPPPPAHILDDALARISATPLASASARLRSAWWGTPARYATAAALVLGLSAAGLAAWHVREADVAAPGRVSGDTQAVTVYRATEPPLQQKIMVQHVTKNRDLAQPAVPPETVAKQHRLARKARLALLVRDVEVALRDARGVVGAAGGDVTALNDATPQTPNTAHGATLDVEVPAAKLDPTLDRLAQLGAVQNKAIDAEDLDASIVDEEARLRNLRREETDLRALMDRGGRVTDILTVQQNLSDVRGQIEQLDAQHQSDLNRVATSTISLALTEDRPNAAPAKPGPTARIDGAWHAGVAALVDTITTLLAAIAWSVAYAPVPLGIAGVAYTAIRLLGKRRATAP